MTTEELLKPRYKVIADYPYSVFKIGEILSFHPMCEISAVKKNSNLRTSDNKYGIDIKYLAKYPHLFKNLEWWEDEWVSVEDELPRNLLNVIVHYDDSIEGYTARGYRINNEWYVQSYSTKIINPMVTHWMPLPKPPINKTNYNSSNLTLQK